MGLGCVWTGDGWAMLTPLRRHDRAIPGSQKKRLRKQPSINQGSKAEYQTEHLCPRGQSLFSSRLAYQLADTLWLRAFRQRRAIPNSIITKQSTQGRISIENHELWDCSPVVGSSLGVCKALDSISSIRKMEHGESVSVLIPLLPSLHPPSISLFLPSSSALRMIELYCIALLCTMAKSHETRRGWREECDAATSKPSCAVSWA